MSDTPTNRKPPDRLAELREQMRILKTEEKQLREGFISGALDPVGDDHVVIIDRKVTPKELNKLVDDTRHSNKRWSTDHSAIVLEISVRNRTKHKLWHLGADDDPNHEIRRGITRAKAAERVRKFRAKHSTGTAKRGRPALELSPERGAERRTPNVRDAAERHAKRCYAI
jgi:hypothetical protein